MNTARFPNTIQQSVSATSSQFLPWAVLISILLHLSAVLLLPKKQISSPPPLPEIISIQIEAPKIPEPVEIAEPEPAPEPPKPTPEPPKPIKKPKPEPKPEPIPVETPAPVEISEPLAESSEITDEVVSSPIMSVDPPKVEAPPTFTAPPPPPPPPPGPSQADLDAARRGYAERLARAIAEHKRYPRVAQMRGWQGEVLIDLKIDENGNVLASGIGSSSGYEVLDKQALEMVAKAAPFPAPPEILKDGVLNIQVPVAFKLE